MKDSVLSYTMRLSPSLRKVRAGTKAEAMDELHCLLVKSARLAQQAFLPPRTTCPEVHYPQWAGPPTAIIHQGILPTDL